MSSFFQPIAISGLLARSVAIAALMGATMLAGPPTAARADSPATPSIQLAQAATPPAQTATPPNQAAAGAAKKTKGETVELRIAKLHRELKITPDEEANWTAVAQAMRENAAKMDEVIAATRPTPPQTLSALDDLKAYEQIARAHIDGLKNLIAAFEVLYTSMPDDQKKIADKVFSAPGLRRAALHH
jgi:periplasmic protein CpxP/Spy